eukprot:351882-Chlamydomonas_euryale.AAC.4
MYRVLRRACRGCRCARQARRSPKPCTPLPTPSHPKMMKPARTARALSCRGGHAAGCTCPPGSKTLRSSCARPQTCAGTSRSPTAAPAAAAATTGRP